MCALEDRLDSVATSGGLGAPVCDPCAIGLEGPWSRWNGSSCM